jgi:hypothetical protein
MYSSPALGSDGDLFVGSGTRIYHLNSDGALGWSYRVRDTVYSSPALGSDGSLYVGDFDNTIYCLDSPGALAWSYRTAHWVNSSPALGSDGKLFIGSYDNNIYCLDPAGALAWSYETACYVYSSPAIGSDGRLYVGTGSGDANIYCLEQEPTVTPTPPPTHTPTITPTSPTSTPTATPFFFVPLNIRLGHEVQPPTGVLSIFADITVEGTAYAGVPCRPYLAVSVGGTLYYIVSGNKLTTKATPYLSNGKSKYFRVYDNIVNVDAAEIPFSGIAPGSYWVYGALLDKNGAPLGPIAERVLTVE